ncbi:hypothetical protein C5Y93_14640 [Blastopirellula marina]|uniref:Uncharacterized protein n=1 Tax=Blastopirellula marina TaxID=124 RepID=A0A2S8GMK1_9BACT|nr:hypothetical protein C5Y93_14640 [Blastopirellula marina]
MEQVGDRLPVGQAVPDGSAITRTNLAGFILKIEFGARRSRARFVLKMVFGGDHQVARFLLRIDFDVGSQGLSGTALTYRVHTQNWFRGAPFMRGVCTQNWFLACASGREVHAQNGFVSSKRPGLVVAPEPQGGGME